MDDQTLSMNKQSLDAAIVATKLRQQLCKRAAVRMMASNIYGHLHGNGLKSQAVKDNLISESVDTALAIWSEVERRV